MQYHIVHYLATTSSDGIRRCISKAYAYLAGWIYALVSGLPKQVKYDYHWSRHKGKLPGLLSGAPMHPPATTFSPSSIP